MPNLCATVISLKREVSLTNIVITPTVDAAARIRPLVVWLKPRTVAFKLARYNFRLQTSRRSWAFVGRTVI